MYGLVCHPQLIDVIICNMVNTLLIHKYKPTHALAYAYQCHHEMTITYIYI